MWEEERGPVSSALEAKTRMKRNLATWIHFLESAQQRLNNLLTSVEKRKKRLEEDPSAFEGEADVSSKEIIDTITQNTISDSRATLATLENLRNEMDLVLTNFANLGDMLDVLKAEADFKGVIVNSWPKNVVADRMTYLGAAFLAAGSGAFTVFAFVFGLPLNALVTLIPPAFLWAPGILLLTWGLWSLRKTERRRWDYFQQQFEIPG